VLREGRCPVIDRCNFDLTQRKHFLSIAREYKAPVDCIVFQFDRKLCVRRCQSRQNHETVAPHIAQEVVSRMINQFSPPLPNRNDFENFRNLQTVDSLDKFNNVVTEYLNLIL
jgi:predicted kinase